jgi:hypothetical protein
MNARCRRSVVPTPFDPHENACEKHEDRREDHHHRIHGKLMLSCHVDRGFYNSVLRLNNERIGRSLS